MLPGEKSDRDAAQITQARKWLWRVLSFVGAGCFLGVIGLAILAKTDRLPSPPLTATACIDEKLAHTRSAAELKNANIIAIGSSATWRNLDTRRLENTPGVKAFNAATCYLHIDQTAFLARHILQNAPSAAEVITVVAPRDFENCAPGDTAIADPFLLNGYLAGTVPGWVIHLANFRLTYLVRQAVTIKRDREGALRSDSHGFSPLHDRVTWNPAPVFDKRCFKALADFRQELARKGIKFVVATIPVIPSWQARFDPDGRIVGQWIDDMRAALGEGALLIDGRELSLPDQRFADPVHLLWPEGAEFTDFVARTLQKPGA